MVDWIAQNSVYERETVESVIQQNQESIAALFDPYPETIFHDDPAKWAELLGNRLSLVVEQELQFV